MVSGFPELIYKDQGNEQLDLGPTASALDLLEAIYRDPAQQLSIRIRCAMACLPFQSPKLLATAIINENDFATLLDQRLKRIAEMKLIEAKPIANETSANENVDARSDIEAPLPDPLARVYSNKFRRRF